MYWAAPNKSYIAPIKYKAELEAANNSLIPFVHNYKINLKYKNNIKNNSIIFYNNSNLDWELSYDSIKYIENIKLFIQNYELLSILLGAKQYIEEDNKLIQNIAYALVLKAIKEFAIIKTSEIHNISLIQTEFKKIYDEIWKLLGDISDADKYKHIHEIYKHFGKTNGYISFSKALESKIDNNIIKLEEGITTKRDFLKDMKKTYFDLQNAIYIDVDDANSYKRALHKDYKDIYVYIFDYYEKLIDLDKNYILFHLYPQISKDIFLIKKIISTFCTDDEKLLFILPFLFLWENRSDN